jgi:hypothetical protein
LSLFSNGGFGCRREPGPANNAVAVLIAHRFLSTGAGFGVPKHTSPWINVRAPLRVTRHLACISDPQVACERAVPEPLSIRPINSLIRHRPRRISQDFGPSRMSSIGSGLITSARIPRDCNTLRRSAGSLSKSLGCLQGSKPRMHWFCISGTDHSTTISFSTRAYSFAGGQRNN